MNEKVRQYLIRKAKRKQAVQYSDINIDCGLSLDFNIANDRKEIGKILGRVSAYEHENNRPLISSIVIYKSENYGLTLGNGFYNLCEELGIGTSSNLKSKNYAELEMNKSFEFWSSQFKHDIEFFTKDDLEYFNKVAKSPYRTNDPESEENSILIKAIYQKSNYWGKLLSLDEYEVELDNRWQSSGYFKAYSWVKIYKKGDKDKLIYFTIGIDKGNELSKGKLIYKLDCQWANSNPEKRLSETQIQIFRKYIDGIGARREIDYEDITDYDWQILKRKTIGFINEYSDVYDELINLIWSSEQLETSKGISLTARPDGRYDEYPEKQFSFKGIVKDFIGENIKKQYIGDKGENLVIEYERNRLSGWNLKDLIGEVRKVKDGNGYDILSYDKNGRIIYIEVKTTKGDCNTPFYLTENERAFAKLNIEEYRIYRLYNFRPTINQADFYIITDIENNVIMKPTLFEVQMKKK